MDVVVHKYIGEDNEVVTCCSLIDSGSQEFADLVVLEIRLTMESGKG
jgi:hypothetical protein